MNTKFQLDRESPPPDSTLVDPEAYDASEQEFAASLEGSPPKFVVKEDDCPFSPPAMVGAVLGLTPETGALLSKASTDKLDLSTESQAVGSTPDNPLEPTEESAVMQHDGLSGAGSPQAWRNEVAARLNHYRSRRRPKEPRYPSLRLKFDVAEAGWSGAEASASPSQRLDVPRIIPAESPTVAAPKPTSVPTLPARLSNGETTARVIPFRRSGNPLPRALEELAEPVLLAPRILEVPEIAPLQPALGGILIEPAEVEAQQKRPGIEVPLQPAPLSRRLTATSIDAALVLTALSLFAYVFFRAAGTIPPPKESMWVALVLFGLLWAAYQYALLVYCGTTPGLGLAGLRLNRFDGSVVPKALRRWRVLASALSGISLGLGYGWCILDEDQLCWHDRITETYMAPRPLR